MLYILFALILTTVMGWSTTPHLIVSSLAWDILNERFPDSVIKVEQELQYLQDWDNEFNNNKLVYREGNYSFIETATFADDIKYRGGAWQKYYHYTQTPYYSHPDQLNETDYTPKIKSKNLTMGIQDVIAWYLEEPGYNETYMYTYLTKKFSSGDETRKDLDERIARSYALRLLIHFVGDIVQPLHNIMMINPEYPTGDLGANKIALPYHYGAKSLHSVWDKGIYKYHKTTRRPFTDEVYAKLNDQATAIRDQFDDTIESCNWLTVDIQHWCDEGYRISMHEVYPEVIANEEIPDDYKQREVETAERQMLLGAYRLAKIVDMILSDDNTLLAEECRCNE